MGKLALIILFVVLVVLLSALAGLIFIRSDRTKPKIAANWRTSAHKDPVFLKIVYSLLAKMALVDGQMNKSETLMIGSVATKEFKLNRENQQLALAYVRKASKSGQSFMDYAEVFNKLYGSNLIIVENMLSLLFQLAICDGELLDDEERLIEEAALCFGMEPETYHKMAEEFRSSKSQRVQGNDESYQSIYGNPDGIGGEKVSAAYSLLGCDPRDTDKNLKKAFNQLAKICHPDKAIAKGLSGQALEEANHKFAEIMNAYDFVCEIRSNAE